MYKKQVLLGGIIALALMLALTFVSLEGWLSVPTNMLQLGRWMAIAMLVWYGVLNRSLTSSILISMVVGIEIGVDFPAFGLQLKVLSDIFLRLVKTIIAPLLFGTLVVGIAGHSNMKQVGRMAFKAILYFEIVTTLALFIGLGAINLSRAGEGIQHTETAQAQEAIKKVSEKHFDLRDIFPENIAKAVAEGNVLQIVVFSILFGVALSMIEEHHKHKMIHFCETLNEVMFKFTHLVMLLAPLAIGGALASTVSTMGLEIFKNLGLLMLTLAGALVVFVAGVLLPIMWYFKIPVLKFWQAIHEPVGVAFATASSDAALPKAMKAMQQFGVHKKVYSFVLPLGYSFNLDGTTLYLSLATIFVAQAGGVHLTFGEQLTILLTLMLSSKGVAGVAKASFVILYATVATFHLPEWPVFIVFAADALMDMARTSVNVIGNCLATVVIAKSEGELEQFDEQL